MIRLFHLQNDEIEEVELPAFDFQHQTLFCANVISDQYLQVMISFSSSREIHLGDIC